MADREWRSGFKLSPQSHRAIRYALDEVSQTGDPARLPDAVRIVVLVHAAQGVIDNGGLQYFFETDFPESPPYSLFVDAYRAIGATAEAEALARAVALFPFPDPHKSASRRNEFLDLLRSEDAVRESPFEVLTHEFYHDNNVWRCLEAFVNANAGRFPGSSDEHSKPGSAGSEKEDRNRGAAGR